MPKSLPNYNYSQNNSHSDFMMPNTRKKKSAKYNQSNVIYKKQKVKKYKLSFLQVLLKISVLALMGVFVLPISFERATLQTFINKIKYRNINVNYDKLYNPTKNYLNNELFLNTPILRKPEKRMPLMSFLIEQNNLADLEWSLKALSAKYPKLHPAVYIWKYEDGSYVNINADEIFPTASIIKVPILLEMFRSIERKEFSLEDKMSLNNIFRSSGSGSLQFGQRGETYSMDKLAQYMIQESDNSSTNMIMSKIGGSNSVNMSLKNWGMQKTSVKNWLPDLEGENVSTAKELSTIIYNINNNNFLNINSREQIIDYMSHVKNNRLIKAGLPQNVEFVHKTGDIGNMLGDAGIVYLPSGQRYIITILVKRPHNDFSAKEFIVAASRLVYNYMISQ